MFAAPPAICSTLIDYFPPHFPQKGISLLDIEMFFEPEKERRTPEVKDKIQRP